MNNTLLELYSIFQAQSLDENIILSSEAKLTDIQSEIYTDKTKLTQILTNLIINALKLTPEGFAEFEYTLKDKELEFYVKDSGIGIHTEIQEIIFERFMQADASRNRKYSGSGLGLAISKIFVELMGGKTWVQSEPDKGSTFYFTIPYNPVSDTN
ncbi:MAG: ATP-binding protein [Bacteroidales bacterium]